MTFFVLKSSDLNLDGFSIFICGIQTLMELRCKISQQFNFFFSMGFLLQTLTIYRTAREGRRPYLLLSTISIGSEIFRNLFVVLLLRYALVYFYLPKKVLFYGNVVNLFV